MCHAAQVDTIATIRVVWAIPYYVRHCPTKLPVKPKAKTKGNRKTQTSFSPELSWLEWEEVRVLLEVGKGEFFLSETS